MRQHSFPTGDTLIRPAFAVSAAPVELTDFANQHLAANVAESFALRVGSNYRIAYASGTWRNRRMSKSVARFAGWTLHPDWTGSHVDCLDFVLPQGRTVSLLPHQLVEARLLVQNERGQWVVQPIQSKSSHSGFGSAVREIARSASWSGRQPATG